RMARLEDHLVPARSEDRGRRRLADVAAPPLAVLRDQLIEAPDRVDPDEMKQRLPRVSEVLAEVIRHRVAELLQLAVDDRLRERPAPAAGGRRLGLLFQGAQGRAPRG